MSTEHVLVVDDELRFRRILKFNLESAGHEVTCVANGEEALEAFAAREPDMIVLDLMLGEVDGFEVCRQVREVSTCPIIIVTARGAEEDKVRGLRLGADDYLTKPFSAQELLARVDAVLRRSNAPGSAGHHPALLTVGNLRIDFRAKEVTVDGREARLSRTEFRLLDCLAAQAGSVVGRDDLLVAVWGEPYRGETDVLRATLWRLRQKLGDDPSNPRFIITRHGIGYMFVGPGTL